MSRKYSGKQRPVIKCGKNHTSGILHLRLLNTLRVTKPNIMKPYLALSSLYERLVSGALIRLVLVLWGMLSRFC